MLTRLAPWLQSGHCLSVLGCQKGREQATSSVTASYAFSCLCTSEHAPIAEAIAKVQEWLHSKDGDRIQVTLQLMLLIECCKLCVLASCSRFYWQLFHRRFQCRAMAYFIGRLLEYTRFLAVGVTVADAQIGVTLGSSNSFERVSPHRAFRCLRPQASSIK